MTALHFNYNVKRATSVDDEGKPILHVKYLKFKERKVTVREAKVASNYDYVAEIYKTLTTTPRAELKLLEEELKHEVPDPMHNMLEDKDKGEAIIKYKRQKERETVIIPPTYTEEELQETNERRTASGRRTPHCSKCGQPQRGHKRDQCQSEDNNYCY